MKARANAVHIETRNPPSSSCFAGREMALSAAVVGEELQLSVTAAFGDSSKGKGKRNPSRICTL